jgi:[pyruvate, water dikinase]-phosphate phosphotransferase / [pyruvate, water dikinase] kinase
MSDPIPGETMAPPIFVISGGTGASAEQVVRTVLAQFPGANVPIRMMTRVREQAQLERAVNEACAAGGTIVHTLLDPDLRHFLEDMSHRCQVPSVDLMGPLADRLSTVLRQAPVNQPGLYRQLHREYFERIEAIEFSVAHDDGQRPEDLAQAEIVLVGVSRVGKTPLTMYLSVQGWRVANVPFVSELDPPHTLLEMDRRRVVGLTIEPGQLLAHRQWRQRRLGVSLHSAYSAPEELYAEAEVALRFYRRHRFGVINVTDKPIETSADEIVSLVERRLAVEDPP